MKAKEQVHRACDNCKYFSFRYYKAHYKFSVALGEGVCGIRKYSEDEQRKLPSGFFCDKWVQKNCDETELSEIKDELEDITARLILITKVLPK